MDIGQIFEYLNSNPRGLDSKEAQNRLNRYGANELPSAQSKSPLIILLGQFKDLMMLVLLAASVLSGLAGDLTDTLVILCIVILNAFLGFFQQYRAEKAIMTLKKMSISHAKVLRDTNTTWLPATDLVPGDIVILEAGDAVSADLRIFESFSLKIEEAALTGESFPIDKTSDTLGEADLSLGDRRNLAFRGTYVTYGRGVAIVVATGKETEFGKIAAMLHVDEVATPLQKSMASFGKRLALIILAICLIFFVSGYFRGEDPVTLFMTSVSLGVAAIPEALPAVITISLALAAKWMVRQNALIRTLPAVETLGSITYICTDKTGTLTRNKMSVEEVFVNGKVYHRNELTSPLDEVTMLLKAFALNNNTITGNGQMIGDGTEIALLEISRDQKVDTESTLRLAEISFDPVRKLMTTFHPWHDQYISFTKGAPEILLERCVNFDQQLVHNEVNKMASKGSRIIGFAYRMWDKMPETISSDQAEFKMHFLGLAAITDPPREHAFDAVQQCKKAGIVPVMITGDHLLTAVTIARSLGIISSENDLSITGKQLASMDHEAFLSMVEHIKVYARVSPEQKLIIVSTLQEKGQLVAMTGDGVNDAPSLRRANLGIAMGITGTDVAKEASHMILLDDNFSTIVQAVRQGRRVYDNILKFINYLLSTNSGELWILLTGPILGLPIALLPIHILWINLVTDGLPAISLSFEQAEEGIMDRPPRKPGESVFADGRGIHIIWSGILTAAMGLGAQWFAIRNGLHWQTIVFNVLVFIQMAHVLALRSEYQSIFKIGLLSNRFLIISILVSLFLQLAVTYTPFLQRVFKTESLSSGELIGVVFVSASMFFVVEIGKWLSRLRVRPGLTG